MFEPVRGGTRGGQAEFKWSDVSADKDRENYLGHSVNAPTGRWQKNKDIHWYNRDIDSGAEARAEEIRKVKELEADALSVALGFEPASKSGGNSTGANAIPVASTSNGETKSGLLKDDEKEEKRRRKEERGAERRARKELKKMSQSGAHGLLELAERSERPRRHPSRSRSPRFRSKERRVTEERRPHSRSRSRTPRAERRSKGGSTHEKELDYDSEERERERERDRRRWELNASRDQPRGVRRY
ncbi:hypothetical protein GALMADRAFT_244800 [Galerina marginata CBS 339.88]|uniref:Multiple myeloma tumor-associated protein 2-like N-terminal domain-containing protein n=1 Tax=Galerina marginata (strain CBS 339.88) TaxID=685588 RepID=A0A067T794_GALM3|nr:hypothetical protein GALMADRAFT_244800 [Galerina marginata CBS 339.88]